VEVGVRAKTLLVLSPGTRVQGMPSGSRFPHTRCFSSTPAGRPATRGYGVSAPMRSCRAPFGLGRSRDPRNPGKSRRPRSCAPCAECAAWALAPVGGAPIRAKLPAENRCSLGEEDRRGRQFAMSKVRQWDFHRREHQQETPGTTSGARISVPGRPPPVAVYMAARSRTGPATRRFASARRARAFRNARRRGGRPSTLPAGRVRALDGARLDCGASRCSCRGPTGAR
jgi:hypothetical protein